MADLRAHFPETLERSPDKWWALSVAQASVANRHEILSAPETVGRLDRILRFSIPAANRVARDYTLGDYRTFLRLAASRAVLRQVSRQLLLLGGRAHPLYRAIVEENRQLVDLLACGKAQGVPERLAWVARHRSVVEREVSAVDDYLNWFEATQSKTSSGAFSQVLEEAAANQTLPRRRDPISVYLDAATMETN